MQLYFIDYDEDVILPCSGRFSFVREYEELMTKLNKPIAVYVTFEEMMDTALEWASQARHGAESYVSLSNDDMTKKISGCSSLLEEEGIKIKFDDVYKGFVIRENKPNGYFVGPDSDRYRVILRAHASRFTKEEAMEYIKNGCFCDSNFKIDGSKRAGDLGFTFNFVIEDAV